MAYEADKVVVELIAKTDQFDQPVKQSATTFKAATKSVKDDAIEMTAAQFKAAGGVDGLTKAFDRNVPAAQRFDRSVRAAQQSSRNLGFQIADIGTQVSSGTSPFIVIAQQGPQVANALAGAQGAVGRFANFLSNPFGAAILTTVSILGVLISKHRGEADSVDALVEKLKQHARQTGLSEEADRIWTKTLDGLIDRQHRLNAELAKRLNTQAAADKADLAQAQKDLGDLQKALSDERARNAQIRTDIPKYERSGEAGALIAASLKVQLQQSNDQIKTLERAITDAQQRITKGAIVTGELQGRAWADLTAKAELWGETQLGILRKIEQQQGGKLAPSTATLTAAYTELKKAIDDAAGAGLNFDATTKQSDKLNAQLRDGKISVRTYATEVGKLATALEKAAEAAKDAKKGTSEFGKQIGFEDAKRIAQGAGLVVTSAQRSTAHQAQLYNDPSVNRPGNPVAKPGTSAHEGVNGKWALDIAFAPGLTAQSLKKLYGGQGVTLSAVYKEKGHFHIEGSRSQAASAESAAARAAAQAARDDQAYDNEKASLESQIINARQALLTSAEDIAKLELDSIDVAHDKYADQVKYQQDAGRLQAAEVASLLKLNDERAALLKEAVKHRLAEQQARINQAAMQRATDVAAAELNAQEGLLQSQEQLARTAKERHEIERRIIDLQYAEEKLRLENQIAIARQVQANKDGAYSAEQIKDAIAAEAAARSQLSTLPARQKNAQTGNDRANAGPLQDYLNSIPQDAAEIDAALQQVAVGGLQSLTDGIADAVANFHSLGDVARSVLQQITQMLIRMVVQQLILKAFTFIGLSGGGAVPGKAQGGRIGFAGGGQIPGFPGGGLIGGVGGPTSDSNLIYASRGEFMIREAAAKRIGYDTLDHINREGQLPGSAGGRMVRPSNATAAGAGRGGFSREDIRTLRGIVGDAARAVPDVSLYASLDPVDMLQRALGTPAGHRALLAHLGANSGAVKGAIK